LRAEIDQLFAVEIEKRRSQTCDTVHFLPHSLGEGIGKFVYVGYFTYQYFEPQSTRAPFACSNPVVEPMVGPCNSMTLVTAGTASFKICNRLPSRSVPTMDKQLDFLPAGQDFVKNHR
jgi:hypothetical protein